MKNVSASTPTPSPTNSKPKRGFRFYLLLTLWLPLAGIHLHCSPSTSPNEQQQETPQKEAPLQDASTEADNSDASTKESIEPVYDEGIQPDSSEPPQESITEEVTPELPESTDTVETTPPPSPRLLALGKQGQIATLALTSPWSIQSTGDLKKRSVSARCAGRHCIVVHPSPEDALSLFDPQDLSNVTTIKLDTGADPRDVAFIDSNRVVVSQYGTSKLLLLTLDTQQKTNIDMSPLADADGNPETLRLAHCGERVFVQLLRLDHKTEAPTKEGAAIGVIDIPKGGTPTIIDTDPNTAGVQPLKLAGQPKFDMPVNCTSGILYIAEPKPLMQGGGAYEKVDLKTLTVSTLKLDHGAEVGGFAVVQHGLYWVISHTATGPAGNSTHLNLMGGPTHSTYNTFADDKLDELILDPQQDLLFFPDNCEKSPQNQQCVSGIHVFHARTGKEQAGGVIPLGFPPMEVAIAQ